MVKVVPPSPAAGQVRPTGPVGVNWDSESSWAQTPVSPPGQWPGDPTGPTEPNPKSVHLVSGSPTGPARGPNPSQSAGSPFSGIQLGQLGPNPSQWESNWAQPPVSPSPTGSGGSPTGHPAQPVQPGQRNHPNSPRPAPGGPTKTKCVQVVQLYPTVSNCDQLCPTVTNCAQLWLALPTLSNCDVCDE